MLDRGLRGMNIERLMELLRDGQLLDWIQQQGGIITWYCRKLPPRVWMSEHPYNRQTIREWLEEVKREYEKEEEE